MNYEYCIERICRRCGYVWYEKPPGSCEWRGRRDMKTFYKLVKKNDKDSNNYTSIFTDGKYKCIYKTGSIVTAPKDTIGLFCFATLEAAAKFASSMFSRFHIIEVSVKEKDIKEDYSITPMCVRQNEEGLDRFYNENLYHNVGICYIPYGTVLVSKLTVVGVIS